MCSTGSQSRIFLTIELFIGMNIAILSRGTYLYSTQSLRRACLRRGHQVRILDHMRCTLSIDHGEAQVYYDDELLEPFDAVIPRIGSSVTQQGAAVINHFEMMKVFCTTSSDALIYARDKLRCLQKLAFAGIDTPKTVSAGEGQNIGPLLNTFEAMPIIVKLLESTHGAGVMLAETRRSAEATVEAFQKLGERVIMQEFIAEASGSDVRAFVVDGKVVAAMERRAKEGEFRSNLHRGASATITPLSAKEEWVAQKAAEVLGLSVAGVDLLRSERGPLVIEVNASPGLEGIETVTRVDVAGKIVGFIEREIELAQTKQLALAFG